MALKIEKNISIRIFCKRIELVENYNSNNNLWEQTSQNFKKESIYFEYALPFNFFSNVYDLIFYDIMFIPAEMFPIVIFYISLRFIFVIGLEIYPKWHILQDNKTVIYKFPQILFNTFGLNLRYHKMTLNLIWYKSIISMIQSP